MKRYIISLLALVCLVGGACEENKQLLEPIGPTTLDLTVLYQDTGLPVDSALVVVGGSKGNSWTSVRLDTIFIKARTNTQGRMRSTMNIARVYGYASLSIDKYARGKGYRVANCPAQCQMELGRTNELILYLKPEE